MQAECFYIAASLAVHQLFDTAAFPVWLKLSLGEILMLIPSVIYLLVTKTNPFSFIPIKGLKPLTILLLVIFAYCMMPLIACVNALSMLVQGNAVSGMLNELLSYPLPLAVLFVAVVPALCEEFIFRGVIYHTYRRQRIWPAVFLSALFFGFMHLNFNQFCYASVMGIFFALLVEATGSVLAPVIVHFTYNANSVVLSYILTRNGYAQPIEPGGQQDFLTMIRQNLEAAGLSPGDPSVGLGVIMGIIITAVIFIAVAAAGSFLGFLVYRGIAKQNGRLMHVKVLFSGKRRREMDAQRLQEPEKILTWEVFAAALLGILYIIWTW